jgi:tetratricopeptide (TPR) repeat protein
MGERSVRRRALLVLLAAIVAAARLARAESAADVAEGERLIAARDPASAEARFRRAIKANPGDARAHSDLALALLLQKKNPDEAAAEARRASELAPDVPDHLLRWGAALQAAGKPDEAAAVLARLVARMPDARTPLLLLGTAYADAGDDRAPGILERAAIADPENPRPRALRAAFLWDSGKVDEGNRAMEEALEKFPGVAELHASYGEQLAIQGRFRTAAEDFEKALALGASSPDLLIALGNAHWSAGDLDRARARLTEATASTPPSAAAELALGRFLLWTGQPDGAIGHLEIAAGDQPNAESRQMLLGRALAAAGRLPEAEARFRRAAELSNSSLPRVALAQTLAREGKAEEARREADAAKRLYDAERAEELARGSHHVQMNLAWEELEHGKPADALRRLEAMGDASDVLEGRGAALARLGRHREAIAIFERASAEDPSNARIRARLSREYRAVQARR